MKNRLISLLLCLVLCVGLLPMAALAENIEPLAVEDGEAMPEPTAEPEPTVEPEVTAEPTATPEVTAEPAEESEPEPDPAAQVQALLDALPDAEAVTAETRAAVEAQLTAIDDARLALDDDSMLDYTRYAAIVAALEALDGTPGASEPETLAITVNDASTLINAVASGGEVTLGQDITLTQTLTISKTVTLKLNGKKLTFDGVAPAFQINSGGTLNLQDTGSGKIEVTNATISQNNAGIALVKGGSIFNMSGGTITGCTSKGDYRAGGVYVAAGGTFAMSGGTISNCRADTANNYAAQYAAGGVYVAEDGTFAMSGGTISGCTANAKYGAGGVYAGGTFTMSGINAKIENCVDNDAWDSAGGVYVPSGGMFNMQNGTITGCKTTGERCAGGVYMSGGSTFTMSGGTITHCTADGTETSASNSNFRAGGVYMSGNSKFTMSGGEISYCSTSVNYSAGGVYVDTNSTFDMTGGIVNVCQVVFTESQKAQNVAGGVYNTGTFSIKGTNGQKKASLLASCVQTKFLDDKNLSSELSDPNERRLVAGNVVNTNKLTMGAYSGITAGYVQCDDQAGGEALSLDIYNTKKLTANGGMAGSIYQKSGATLTKSASAGYTTEFSNGGVNCGEISAGEFTGGILSNHGTINAGKFAAEQLYNYGTISAGKFTGGTLSNYGTISAGEFTDTVDVIFNRGTITNGTFNCAVQIDSYTTTIDGSEVIKGGTISGGTFTGKVEVGISNYDKLSVTGGDFSKAYRVQGAPIGITFDLNGASEKAPATQWRWYAKATEPTAPTRDGYHFCGWYRKGDDEQPQDTRWNFESLLDQKFAYAGGAITLCAKWEELFTTAPAAKTGLTYNGAERELITQGTLSSYAEKNDYTLQYKLSTDSAYSATVPTGKNAGNYTVNYRVMKGSTVETSGSVNVTIAPKTVTKLNVAPGPYIYNGREHTPGVTVMDGSQVVPEGAYTVSYSDNINAGTATVTVTDNAGGNYNVTASGSFTIAPRNVTVSGITAEDKIYDGKTTATLNCDNVTFDGKLDDDELSVTATGTFADKNVGNGKTVNITVLTLDGTAKDNYTLTKKSMQMSITADITAKEVTLKSADDEKAYDGEALTAETVTATGMADGEEFDYDFTGSQTDIGASENEFTAKDSDTAKVANYDITYDYGTLRVTVPAGIGDGTEDMSVDTVTSDDRKTIEDTLKTVDEYLGMEPTKDEATKLNELKNKLEDLLEKLDEAKAASEDKTITDTDGIDKDNAKSSDKQKLEDAKDAIEKVLEDYETNLTDAEKQELNDKLDRIEDALERLDEAKAASEDKTITDADDIDKDNAKSSDKKKLEDAKDAIEKALEDYDTNLTDEEKQELNDKLDRIEDALERLDEAKAASEDKTITDTDDIDKDNAKSSDKKKLEDAKDAIEKALEDYDTNLTDEEKQELNDKLDRINAALDAIAAAEAAAKAARTGDEAMPMLWLALALSAALALGYTARKKKD